MICKICNIRESIPDHAICQVCRDSNEHYAVNLLLDGLDTTGADFGVVLDCNGSKDFIPEETQVVGIWARYNTGVWVSLKPTIEALQDDLILFIKDIAHNEKKKPKKASSKSTVKKENKVIAAKEDIAVPIVEPAISDAMKKLLALRADLLK